MNTICEIKKELINDPKRDIGINRIIYKITNLINGKIYIGKDKYNDPNYFGSGKLIKLAIEKYGKLNFKKEILESCDCDISTNDRERYWIKFFKSTNKSIGYNISHGGGDWGDVFTDNPNKHLIIEKIRKTCKEKFGTLEHRKLMSIRLKGKLSPHKNKKRPELLGKNVRFIGHHYQQKIIEMYKIMGVCKISKILKKEGFPHGIWSIITFLKRRGLYTREGKRGPFGENILKKRKDGKFVSKSIFCSRESQVSNNT